MSEIAWLHNYDEAMDRAKTERKFVVLDIFNPG